MVKVYFLIFVWGPALLGISLGWLVAHPDDWTGPAVMIPVGAVVTWLTYRWGRRKGKALGLDQDVEFLAALYASPLLGVVLFVLFAFGVLG
jgi:hypothetical protein